MPMDAVCLSAVVAELEQTLVGAKIDKIHQPERDELILALRADRNCRLLLSAAPGRARAQLTELSRENPASPPMFCMLMRKHLSGGRILSLRQPEMERVLDLEIEALDEMGERVRRHLILEAIGRKTNLILVDEEKRIIDCIRRVDLEASEQRQLLPGMFYRFPLSPDREDLMDWEEERLREELDRAPEDQGLDRWLLDRFFGLSPLICRELAAESTGRTDTRFCEIDNGEREAFLQALCRWRQRVRDKVFRPVMLVENGIPKEFSYQPVFQYGSRWEQREMESFSALLDVYYEERDRSERIRQRGQDLLRTAKGARDRLARKLALQQEELEATNDRERQRELGDLVTSNLHRLEKGMSRFVTQDFYDPEGREVEIQLDPLKTPQQNAARYYRNYTKAKTARLHLTEQIHKGESELSYLSSVLEELDRAEGERDLMEIRQELEQAGYIRRGKKAAGRGKLPPSKPLRFVSSGGIPISVGRNNRQNDLLTTKEADRRDLWFHTQKIHGSHVILHTGGQEPDPQSMEEAAKLAAWYSQAKDGANVPVDLAQVRHVKKPAGARPGMVVYEIYQTVYVTPDPELVKGLTMAK